MTLREKLFSFDGRLRRRDWWLISICLSLLSILLGEAVRYLLLGPAWSVFASGWSAVIALSEPRAGLLGLAVSLLVLWPYAAVSIKRRHDRGHGAGLVIAAFVWSYAYPVALFLLPLRPDAGMGLIALYSGVGLLNAVISLWMLAIFGILDGTEGSNRFGPSPKRIIGTPD